MDDASAADLVGKKILIGITYVDKDENPLEQVQLYGTIEVADARGAGVRIQGEARRGEFLRLPPDRRAFKQAEPGEYRLRTTGEVGRRSGFDLDLDRGEARGGPGHMSERRSGRRAGSNFRAWRINEKR